MGGMGDGGEGSGRGGAGDEGAGDGVDGREKTSQEEDIIAVNRATRQEPGPHGRRRNLGRIMQLLLLTTGGCVAAGKIREDEPRDKQSQKRRG